MSRRSSFAVALALFALSTYGIEAQQQAQAGPVIQSGGAVFAVEPTFKTPLDLEYKVAFEVATTPDAADQLNVTFNSVARFINMHAQAGVPREHIRTAIVVHGPAAWDLLNDAAYQEHTGGANPNTALLQELMAAGTKVILCGQTAASRGVPTDR
ncbi:MAG: DsrE family protein, partial [Acidobacteria bacterium]|nr:DsrE family protein [Acidobacteriota bacterium]